MGLAKGQEETRGAPVQYLYTGSTGDAELVAGKWRDARGHGIDGRVLEAGVEHLEGQFEILLVNAQHIKAVPGRKTDQKDSEWIADLLQHRLLKRSFVPPTPVRELRDLTRYRVSLAQECNRIANRVQKVLGDANIKLSSVATDDPGRIEPRHVGCLIEGKSDSQELAEMSKALLRNKKPGGRLLAGWHPIRRTLVVRAPFRV